MSTVGIDKRPGGVTLVAVLIFIAAIVNIIFGVWLIVSPIGDNPTVHNSLGQAKDIPTLWLIMNGLLTLLLGVIYLWLGRMTLAGSASAQVLIQVLAVINIVFALFRLADWSGWLAIVINVLILGLVSTKGAKAWFTRVP
ncbi:MAG: hypothetical protein NTZ03_00690 [Actinobacteria bacterium]|nr:hypothetical protein [Actinomycetota bacterium]